MKPSSQPPPPEPVGAPEGNGAYVDMCLLLGWYANKCDNILVHYILYLLL